jgi:hypothetical protein
MEKQMTPHVDGRNDFDFLYGKWNIVNRRRRHVFQGCEDWQEFPATCEVEPVLGGMGHIEKFETVFPNGMPLEGLTVRIFNPQTQLWSLHWSDSHSCTLFPAVVGRFVNGRGEFYGADSANGREIQVAFTWSEITGDSARWAQAFSLDDGRTWEWNWEMHLSRVSNVSRLRADEYRPLQVVAS